ncbi:MAG: hypothetical protein N3E45_12740 [Oscillatoriaceae bacterium SKW80]|nr:hypothetical protein [Oscillatoriaceae bacterium SKYG93]MCX8121667.1 hypothetical protein [Oscillatoriaceae bacterium SKW80]MDW8453975.1 hypothetical protein [Oscillatoriaceae cyanobacterium SKYGB_i_bin93]
MALLEDSYESGHPQPKDILLLLVEVADTTIEYDRKIKVLLTLEAIY